MSPNVRKTIYTVLAVVNSALLAATQQNMLPEKWAHFAALASFVIAASMKEFSAEEPK